MIIKDTGMARIKNSNGAENVITWAPARAGGIRVNNDFYGASGYYSAAKSFSAITTLESYAAELDAARDSGLTVNLY